MDKETIVKEFLLVQQQKFIAIPDEELFDKFSNIEYAIYNNMIQLGMTHDEIVQYIMQLSTPSHLPTPMQ